MADFASTHRSHLETHLEEGEELRGICAATQHSTFKGRAVAIGVTDRRLLVQPLDRRGRPSGDVISIAPEQVASARAGDAGGTNLASAIVNATSATLILRTTGGDRLKLMMMDGTGVLGRLGGGETQRQGVEALADWLGHLDPGV